MMYADCITDERSINFKRVQGASSDLYLFQLAFPVLTADDMTRFAAVAKDVHEIFKSMLSEVGFNELAYDCVLTLSNGVDRDISFPLVCIERDPSTNLAFPGQLIRALELPSLALPVEQLWPVADSEPAVTLSPSDGSLLPTFSKMSALVGYNHLYHVLFIYEEISSDPSEDHDMTPVVVKIRHSLFEFEKILFEICRHLQRPTPHTQPYWKWDRSYGDVIASYLKALNGADVSKANAGPSLLPRHLHDVGQKVVGMINAAYRLPRKGGTIVSDTDRLRKLLVYTLIFVEHYFDVDHDLVEYFLFPSRRPQNKSAATTSGGAETSTGHAPTSGESKNYVVTLLTTVHARVKGVDCVGKVVSSPFGTLSSGTGDHQPLHSQSDSITSDATVRVCRVLTQTEVVVVPFPYSWETMHPVSECNKSCSCAR